MRQGERENLVEKEAGNHETSKYKLLSVHGETEGGGGTKSRNEVLQTNVAVLLSVHRVKDSLDQLLSLQVQIVHYVPTQRTCSC